MTKTINVSDKIHKKLRNEANKRSDFEERHVTITEVVEGFLDF